MRLVLASASPRRAELLTAAGFVFDIHPVDVDERVRPGEKPEDYVRRLAEEKAAVFVASGFSRTRDIASGFSRTLNVASGFSRTREDNDVCILAADTAVVVDGDILGKPSDDADARCMLERLSGRSHRVLTGVCVSRPGGQPDRLSAVDSTTVWFLPLSRADIDWYVASGEGRDKAGAYAIQGLASRLIPRIEGSYSNVVGLPMAVVHELTTRISVPRFR